VLAIGDGEYVDKLAPPIDVPELQEPLPVAEEYH
jgi:hypothetical protein